MRDLAFLLTFSHQQERETIMLRRLSPLLPAGDEIWTFVGYCSDTSIPGATLPALKPEVYLDHTYVRSSTGCGPANARRSSGNFE